MVPQPRTKLTYDDYLLIPDDGRRHEIIDGEEYVTPAPNTRHQDIAGEIYRLIANHLVGHGGGRVLLAPYDVVLSKGDVVQPDVIFVSDENAGVITEANIQGAPTLVVEVISDPRMDRLTKRDLYARHRVPEYWVVDPDSDRVEVHRLTKEGYGKPEIMEPGEKLSTEAIPGFELDLTELFRR